MEQFKSQGFISVRFEYDYLMVVIWVYSTVLYIPQLCHHPTFSYAYLQTPVSVMSRVLLNGFVFY